MAKGREVVDFHQWDCKKPRIWPLDPSHLLFSASVSLLVHSSKCRWWGLRIILTCKNGRDQIIIRVVCFMLWLKVERLLISINEIARNQEFGLLTLEFTLETKVQRSSSYKGRCRTLIFDLSFHQSNRLLKEVSVGQKPKLG